MEWLLLETSEGNLLYDFQLLAKESADFMNWYRNGPEECAIRIRYLEHATGILKLELQPHDTVIPVGSVDFVNGIHMILQKPFVIHDNFHPDVKPYILRSKYGTCTISTLPFMPIFIKPLHQNKIFDGVVVSSDTDIAVIIDQVKRNGHDLNDSTEIYYSEVVDFKAEYRALIIPGKVVSLALYACDRDAEQSAYENYGRVYKTATNIAKHLQELKREKYSSMVIDLGMRSSGAIDVVECANHVLTASLYSSNIDRQLLYRILLNSAIAL